MLKILGKASSINVRKVLWACDEVGKPFEREDWGSGHRDAAAPEFLALNPNGLVPVLIDGDLVLWESNTIIRYLAAAYGPGHLLPEAPRDRALVEKWMDWQATELNNAWRYAFQALVRGGDFEAETRRVVALGGDTDTNAAVAGALLGARDGVDALTAAWLERLEDAEAIRAEAEALVPLAEARSA